MSKTGGVLADFWAVARLDDHLNAHTAMLSSFGEFEL